ncbi:MAG TPA: class A beta-lactamase-related serine hydrolase [Selenomonadales bacterium]|nr:class A beta-lactamase-related serine hydrolase [Selenomonadales bacterium]
MKQIAALVAAFMFFSGVAFAGTPAAFNSTPREVVDYLKNFDGKAGVYAKNLKTGRSLSYNEDVVFPTASTSKLVVALAVYKYLYPAASPAKRDYYDQTVARMITVSDNNAFYEMLDEAAALRPDAFKRVTRDLRLKRTQIHDEDAFKRYDYHSVTTPYEMARVLDAICNSKYLPKAKATEFRGYLANTIYNDEIPRFMETRVMHKVGELDSVLCDVGIIDDGKDQILISVYTSTSRSGSYASDYIANTAAKAYNALRRK